MPQDQLIAVGVLVGAILLFVRDALRPDIVGLCAILALLFSGILTPREAFAGFSDPLVVLLAALFVVGGALQATGVTSAIADRLGPLAGIHPKRVLLVLVGITVVLSSILSSTGTVALLLPVALDLAGRAGMSPSRVLIPLAYAAGLGGTLTLVSTPPNLVGSEALIHAGLPGFGFFSLSPIGLAMTLIGMVILIFGHRLLPERSPAGPTGASGLTVRDLDRRGWIALSITAAMLVLLVIDLLPTVTTVLMAATALGLTRCVAAGDLYRHVPIGTVVLVATMLPLSTALEKTGALASAIAPLSHLLTGTDPRVVVGGLFAITSVVGLAISNTATAVLIAPIAIGLASHTGIDPRCLVATVALSASCSFATPIATPMNALVLEPGKYRFTDYLRLGVPLQLTLGIVIVLLVPVVFPPFPGS